MRLLICLALLALARGAPRPLSFPSRSLEEPLDPPTELQHSEVAPAELPVAEPPVAEQPTIEAAEHPAPHPADDSEELPAFFWIFSAFGDPLEVLELLDYIPDPTPFAPAPEHHSPEPRLP